MLYYTDTTFILEVLLLLFIVPMLLAVAFVTVAKRKTMASMLIRVRPLLAYIVLFFLGSIITLVFTLLASAVVPVFPELTTFHFDLAILFISAVYYLTDALVLLYTFLVANAILLLHSIGIIYLLRAIYRLISLPYTNLPKGLFICLFLYTVSVILGSYGFVCYIYLLLFTVMSGAFLLILLTLNICVFSDEISLDLRKIFISLRCLLPISNVIVVILTKYDLHCFDELPEWINDVQLGIKYGLSLLEFDNTSEHLLPASVDESTLSPVREIKPMYNMYMESHNPDNNGNPNPPYHTTDNKPNKLTYEALNGPGRDTGHKHYSDVHYFLERKGKDQEFSNNNPTQLNYTGPPKLTGPVVEQDSGEYRIPGAIVNIIKRWPGSRGSLLGLTVIGNENNNVTYNVQDNKTNEDYETNLGLSLFHLKNWGIRRAGPTTIGANNYNYLKDLNTSFGLRNQGNSQGINITKPLINDLLGHNRPD